MVVSSRRVWHPLAEGEVAGLSRVRVVKVGHSDTVSI